MTKKEKKERAQKRNEERTQANSFLKHQLITDAVYGAQYVMSATLKGASTLAIELERAKKLTWAPNLQWRKTPPGMDANSWNRLVAEVESELFTYHGCNYGNHTVLIGTQQRTISVPFYNYQSPSGFTISIPSPLKIYNYTMKNVKLKYVTKKSPQ